MKKITKILGIILVVMFGFGTLNWMCQLLGLWGDFWIEDDMPMFLLNIAMLIIGIIITKKSL
ncbi:MAG: hypothetical protein IJ727_04460 [Treponema sp.]|nr:hypothetical protein [Treponema sp.]